MARESMERIKVVSRRKDRFILTQKNAALGLNVCLTKEPLRIEIRD
jgi:hypothetical protein